MIFKRRTKYPELQLTQRQIAAMEKAPERRAKKQKAALPLLADLIEVESIDIDAVIDHRKNMAAQSERLHRDFDASVWRKARAEFFAAPLNVQLKIALHWCYSAGNHMPATPTNFSYIVRQHTKPWCIADARKPRVIERQKWIDALRQSTPRKAA